MSINDKRWTRLGLTQETNVDPESTYLTLNKLAYLVKFICYSYKKIHEKDVNNLVDDLEETAAYLDRLKTKNNR